MANPSPGEPCRVGTRVNGQDTRDSSHERRVCPPPGASLGGKEERATHPPTLPLPVQSSDSPRSPSNPPSIHLRSLRELLHVPASSLLFLLHPQPGGHRGSAPPRADTTSSRLPHKTSSEFCLGLWDGTLLHLIVLETVLKTESCLSWLAVGLSPSGSCDVSTVSYLQTNLCFTVLTVRVWIRELEKIREKVIDPFHSCWIPLP